MMNKKLLLWACLAVRVVAADAQDEEAVKHFVNEYSGSKGGIMTGADVYAGQIGAPVPDFYFTDKLNSKALMGKTVVLDFWATWCAGCLVVSAGLDSLMLKESDVYRNVVQVIGVNTQEKRADKGYNAYDYWKKTHKSFPMVDGAAADSLGSAVHNGFPTSILVDARGIVRRRWDGATPATANAIRIACWQYAVYPEIKSLPVTTVQAKQFLDSKDWVSALYFLESLPINEQNILLKFEAMLHLSEKKAYQYLTEIKEKHKNDTSYLSLVSGITSAMVKVGTCDKLLVIAGLEFCDELEKSPGYINNYKLWYNRARLHWAYGEYERRFAVNMANTAIAMMAAGHGNYTPEEKAEMKRIREQYGQ